MPELIVETVDTELADIQAKSGINEGTEADIDLNVHPAEKKEEPKAEDKSEEDKSKEEEPPKDPKDLDKKGEKAIVRTSKPAPQSERPLKAAFKQIGELRESIKQILEKVNATPADKKEVKEVLDDSLKTIAEKYNLDPAVLEEMGSALKTQLLKQLEASGVLKKDMPAELTEKLKALDKLQQDQEEQAQTNQFNTEWNSLLPELGKQFPNASATELSAARDLMEQLAHDPKTGGVIIDDTKKIMKGFPLDYILFQNRKAFETILKVVKGKKGAEGAGKKITETESSNENNDGEDIDLDPENITPEKMAAHEKKKYNRGSEKAEMIG